MSSRQDHDATETEVLTTKEARQAIAPNRVRYMLIIGIPVVILGLLAAYWLVR